MSASVTVVKTEAVSSKAEEAAGLLPVEWLAMLGLFITAAFWLVLSSGLALVSSIKFHSPAFLADTAWLTYGRARAASSNLLLYGFCVPGGMGVALWILMRSGRAALQLPVMGVLSVLLFNLGALMGLLGILRGDASGHVDFEFPGYAAAFVFLGFVAVGVSAALTLHSRRNADLSVPQWHLLASVFWFPWIYSTAVLLLLLMPLRGMAQAVVSWWFSANFQLVWMGLVGLGAAFYLLPKALGREPASRNLALFCFWSLILFGSWTGVPQTASVPAWLPALSAAATFVSAVLYLGVLVAWREMARGACRESWRGAAAFVSFGLSAFLISGILSIVPVAAERGELLSFTWAGLARTQLLVYGFFGMILFGCMHAAIAEFAPDAASPRVPRAQFWLAGLGIALLVLPLAGAGVMQLVKMRNPDIAFVDVSKSTLHFLRLSTMGDLLILVANALLLVHLISTVAKALRVKAVESLASVMAEVKS
jgi:cytochrome c oxidase cbb3-type subunit 1